MPAAILSPLISLACNKPNDNKNNINDINKNFKYSPASRNGLIDLVNDENVNLGDIDTSKITNMSNLFSESYRTDYSGIDKWDVSNVKYFDNMFELPFPETREKVDMSKYNFNNWNLKSAESMYGIFGNLNIIPDISKWNLSNVRDLRGFLGSGYKDNYSKLNININSIRFDLPETIYNVDKQLAGLSLFFHEANVNKIKKPTNYKEEGQDFKKDATPYLLKKPDGNIKYRPKTRHQLRQIVRDGNVDLSTIDVKFIDNIDNLFDFEISKERLAGVNSWDTSNIQSMKNVFKNQDVSLLNINNWNTEKVEDMSGMFEKTKGNIDTSNWVVSKVRDFSNMFAFSHFNNSLEDWDVSNR
ncbi:BspA family leucine-rich repeat surface protein [Mycoplasma struthionis]|uniref:BspA family leucine-rich repeat surface protein n=1 Tax=Mycoplasma struthionis TaxID=538220 RepID=A0A3G8LFZ8_9MOLU|nr:BspA family leucine-rich repeat surface protein [Mycoplasma struthionis]AZG68579.1 BspA family leucine-rich repeat surface protein [Mycoplasma struthionis]